MLLFSVAICIVQMKITCIYRSVFSYLRTYADMALLEFTYRCCSVQTVHQSIDSSCLPSPQKQLCSSWFAAVGPCWDRQTDRQTLYCYIHPVPHTMRAVPICF